MSRQRRQRLQPLASITQATITIWETESNLEYTLVFDKPIIRYPGFSGITIVFGDEEFTGANGSLIFPNNLNLSGTLKFSDTGAGSDSAVYAPPLNIRNIDGRPLPVDANILVVDDT